MILLKNFLVELWIHYASFASAMPREVFSKISCFALLQYSQENTCVGISFLTELQKKNFFKKMRLIYRIFPVKIAKLCFDKNPR